MKKVLFIAFTLMLGLCLSIGCFAQEEGQDVEAPSPTEAVKEQENDIKAYIMDKIVPIAVAVLTSAVAFLATLGTIARSLKALKDTKDAFKDEAKERAIFFESGIEMLDEKTQELKELVEDVPRLRGEISALAEECRLNSEILTLGFSANSEVIKSGKGKKMAALLENAKFKMQISDTPRTRADRRSAIGEVELMQGSEASRNAKSIMPSPAGKGDHTVVDEESVALQNAQLKNGSSQRSSFENGVANETI